jgi:hypothetical protein
MLGVAQAHYRFAAGERSPPMSDHGRSRDAVQKADCPDHGAV